MKALVAFYASPDRGSEYRSGWEFIKFAAKRGFDIAIVADLEHNMQADDSNAAALGIKIVQIGSPVRSQAQLYRWSDFWVQQVWHRRVAGWIRNNAPDLQVLWVQNGAQPWLPIKGYLGLSPFLVWGPVGGGDAPPANYLHKMPFLDALRERLRHRLQLQQLRRKVSHISKCSETVVVPIARTVEAQSLLSDQPVFGRPPVIPEILWPLSATASHKQASTSPTFIWVGQDLPRKNLNMAIELFLRLKEQHFPKSTLEIFGTRRDLNIDPSIKFHGWVSKIEWGKFASNGVLLLTSYREGLPSVILEAMESGLYCISTNIGSISSLNSSRIYILSMTDYPNVLDYEIENISIQLKAHLSNVNIVSQETTFDNILDSYLQQEGVI